MIGHKSEYIRRIYKDISLRLGITHILEFFSILINVNNLLIKYSQFISSVSVSQLAQAIQRQSALVNNYQLSNGEEVKACRAIQHYKQQATCFYLISLLVLLKVNNDG